MTTPQHPAPEPTRGETGQSISAEAGPPPPPGQAPQATAPPPMPPQAAAQAAPPQTAGFQAAPPHSGPVPGPVPPMPAAPPPAPPEAAGPRVVDTDADAKDGLSKCPRCGATEISLNTASGLLRCSFCRHEWTDQVGGDDLFINQDIRTLTGMVIGSGSQDIIASTEDVLTFKCSACGAEVVINTAESTQARCHWCRNTLSMNQQIPNGAVPDMVLPFAIPKEQAVTSIRAFVKKRRTFSNPRFIMEIDPMTVLGDF